MEATSPLWTVQTEVVVTEGDPYALVLENRIEYVGHQGFGKNEKLTPSPLIIIVDAIGNKNVAATHSGSVKAEPFYVNDDTGNQTSPQVSWSSRVLTESIGFPDIVLDYVHGASHFVRFSSAGLRDAVTPPLRTKRCETTTFKVRMSAECRTCPTVGAVCYGNETVAVLPGYWRASRSISDIYECESGSNGCAGSSANRGCNCSNGLTGPLCSLCLPGWGKSGRSTCTPCAPLVTNIVFVLGFSFAILIILTAWSVVTLRKSEITDFSVILRTVTNHMQATGKLGEFSNQWDPFLKSIFQIQSAGSDFSVGGISAVECLLQAADKDYETIFWAYMMLPLIPFILGVLVYVLVRVFDLKPVITKQLQDEIEEEVRHFPNSRSAIILQKYPFYMVLITTLSVGMFTMYQMLISQSTSVLQCKAFVVDGNSTESYLAADMSIPCTADGDHRFRAWALVCSITYGFGVPLAFVASFILVRGRLAKPELTKLMFMFLIGGYKEEYWYWQALIMVRKMVLVLSIVFLSDNKLLQSYCGMWVMSVALVLQIYFSPAIKPEHNLVEALSLAIITITLNLGLLYFWEGMPSAGKDTLTAVLILITLGATCMFCYYMYEPLKDTIIQGIQSVVAQIHDILDPKSNVKRKALHITQIVRDVPVDSETTVDLSKRHKKTFDNVTRMHRVYEPAKFDEVEMDNDTSLLDDIASPTPPTQDLSVAPIPTSTGNAASPTPESALLDIAPSPQRESPGAHADPQLVAPLPKALDGAYEPPLFAGLEPDQPPAPPQPTPNANGFAVNKTYSVVDVSPPLPRKQIDLNDYDDL